MEYVIDENGNIKVGKNKQPLVKGDDGKEFEINAIGAQQKITELNSEAAGYRKKASERKTQLEAFGELDPVKAKEALQLVSTMDSEHKVEIDKLKTELGKSYQSAIEEKDTEIEKLKGNLFKTNVLANFATSEVVKKTILPPDIAATYFQKHFDQDGTAKDSSGNVIYSKRDPGKPASFDEALESIIDNYPNKKSILRSEMGNGGGGGQSLDGDNGGGGKPKTSVELIRAGLEKRGL